MLLACTLIVAAAINADAQHRAERTASARAYYGQHHGSQRAMYKAKRKQLNTHPKTRMRPAKGTRSDAWDIRKKMRLV